MQNPFSETDLIPVKVAKPFGDLSSFCLLRLTADF